ncbi:MAG: FGGY-family carbohydrate kinase [Phycisphaeraceae bacterium]
MRSGATTSGPIWLGVDVGTQSARVLAVSPVGEVLGAGTCKLASRRDGVRHEQDPATWWNAVVEACRAALAALPAERIAGVAVDGTSGTVLLADERGAPLTPGIMYDDGRAAEEARAVNEVGGEVWARLGYRMQPSWALPKVVWLARHHQLARGAARLLHQTDFINRQLVGREVVSDTSTALKSGYDLLEERWPGEVLDALRIDRRWLPEVVRPGSGIGEVGREAAAATGIPEGTPVIAGMTDGCAAQIGAGALRVGSWNVVLGTTLVFKGVTPELIRDPAGVVYCHRSPDGNWLPGGASSTGAGALTHHFPNRDLDELSSRAAAYEPAGVVAYPLVSRGERFPFIAPEAEGFMLGESRDEAQRYAALLQGVALVERLCFDYLDMLGAPVDGELRLTGGGAKSRYWCQLRADVLGRPVCLPEQAEAALGMAVLAASHGRRVADVAGEMVRVRETIEPRADGRAKFDEAYLQLVNALARRGWLPEAVAAHARKRAER